MGMYVQYTVYKCTHLTHTTVPLCPLAVQLYSIQGEAVNPPTPTQSAV
jgi:hypothetical protein